MPQRCFAGGRKLPHLTGTTASIAAASAGYVNNFNSLPPFASLDPLNTATVLCRTESE